MLCLQLCTSKDEAPQIWGRHTLVPDSVLFPICPSCKASVYLPCPLPNLPETSQACWSFLLVERFLKRKKLNFRAVLKGYMGDCYFKG